MTEILKLIENDSRLTPEKIALMLDKEVGDIKNMIAKYERDGVILGYKTLIDWDKTDKEHVSALIELKITPQRDRGYDHVAQKIYNYPEVESLYLMSGSFDLTVIIEGKSMKEVSRFVTEKLSTLEYITSTATYFVLKKYKEHGLIMTDEKHDSERMLITP